MINQNYLYEVKKGHEEKCGAFSGYGGKYVKFHNEDHYWIYNENMELIEDCSCFTEDDLVRSDRLIQGDILVNEEGDKRKVFGVCGEVHFLSAINCFKKGDNGNWTLQEIKDYGYSRLDDDTPEAIEIEGGKYTFDDLKKKFKQ